MYSQKVKNLKPQSIKEKWEDKTEYQDQNIYLPPQKKKKEEEKNTLLRPHFKENKASS